jgi:L-fuconolactonase
VIIDAHQHVWDLSRADYPWLDAGLAPIDRTMEFSEIEPAMREVGVGATVFVQSADNEGDTANMLRVADAHPQVVGVVAWVPLDEPARAAGMLERLRRDDRVVGVRALLHTYADPEWILRPDVDESLGLLESGGVPFDFVVANPAALALVPTVSERHPGLSIVLDHLGKPPIGGSTAERDTWRQLLSAAASNPRISAKVSGLYSASGDMAAWTVDAVRPFVADALELFGADRLMVGGDWPISVLAGGYERTWNALLSLARELSPHEAAALLGGTAAAVYALAAARLAAADPDGVGDASSAL